jgi:hypothetical protein
MLLRGNKMPIEILKEKLDNLSESQRQSVFDYINFLLFQNSSSNKTFSNSKRLPGGLTKLEMSDDFDEPLDCFKGYI